MANPVALPGTVVSSGAAVSPGGAQGIAGESYPIGVIVPYASTTAPPTWMLCDGSAISRTTYPALFTLIGTTFGAGDGSTTFNLPDLRGRVGVGAGQGASLTNRVLAATGGEETHPLTIAELASHTHIDSGHAHNVFLLNNVNAGGSGANSVAGSGSSTPSGTSAANLANTGSGTAHNNMEPFLVVAYIIKVSSGGGATAQAPLADSTQSGLLRQVSGLTTDYVGGDNTCHALLPAMGSSPNTFVAKSTAYTLVTADSGKYFICSGGSWTLTLPPVAQGFMVWIRNDQGISGTTGTITLAPVGGKLIDGLASLALLPGQDCLIGCDGANWRTFGLKREVILGTQDITTAQANGIILLPAGYRYFELEFTSFTPVTNNDYLIAQLSSDGGTTWYTTTYYAGGIYDNSATTVAFSQVISTSNWTIGQTQAAGSNTGELRMVLYPGSASTAPAFHADSTNFTGSLMYKWLVGGFLNTLVRINALKYFGGLGGNFTSLLTVKGVV